MNSTLNFEKGNTIGELYSIGKFLEEFSVHVPMLQRDYAQGRENKGYIREKFLSEIKKTINDNNNKLTLDFIYGYKDKGKNEIFFPLDGQQRLTTVWLVYWYLALRAEKLSEERDSLIKFSYETRKSSREFCEALCSNKIILQKDEKIVEYIQKQTWFFALWKKDPSIKAMLITLGGTTDNDGIEPLFKDLAKNKNRWKNLLEKFKSNICFYVLDIGNEKMPIEVADRLYVKMNARGKSLTDFENFKADFISHIKNAEEFKGKTLSDKNFDVEISAKLDNDWNDIFWKSAPEVFNNDDGGQTDEIFFAFINRYCFNLLCVNSDQSFLGLIKKIDEILDENNSDGKIDNDKKITVSIEEKNDLQKYKYFIEENHFYEDFNLFYRDLLSFDTVNSLSLVFEHLKDHFDDISKVLHDINIIVSKRESVDYHFIPYYEKDNNGKKVFITDKGGNKTSKVKGTTNKERLYFFAICEYLEENQFDVTTFNNWMRFCRNIIENSGIDSVGAMISCMKALNTFKGHTAKIYTDLSSYSQKVSSNPTKYEIQLAEEIEKSKQTTDDVISEINEAEKYSVFCGRIGFLFRNNSGGFDWSNFAVKYNKAKDIFSDATGEVNYDSVKKYCESFSDFGAVKEKMIFHQVGWRHRGDNWLDVLYEDYEKSDLLLRDRLSKASGGPYDQFLQSGVFEKIVKKESIMEGKKDIRVAWYNDKWALYKSRAQGDKLYFDNDYFKRSAKIKEILDDTSVSNFSVESKHDFNLSESYFWGEDIEFSYNGRNYIWTIDDKICEYQNGKKGGTKIQGSSLKAVTDIIESL